LTTVAVGPKTVIPAANDEEEWTKEEAKDRSS